MAPRPSFYEFFAGGGMARAGLGAGWDCLFANDIDAKKAAAYVANWGDAEFRLGDIHDLTPADLPGRADLAWASFPCQDLSLAGNGEGLSGAHSGAFWGFYDLIHALKLRRRAPRLLVLENVGGAVTSKDGRDFTELCKALQTLGCVFGAVMLDAVHFIPQSRPRIFFVAAARDAAAQDRLAQRQPEPWTTNASLAAAVTQLPPELRRSWCWWRLPQPPMRTITLDEIVLDAPPDVAWHATAETQRLLGMMSAANIAKVRAAQALDRRVVGTIYRRTRRDDEGRKAQRAEVRFDGVAGCLRTPRGGSSRQTLIFVEGRKVRTRLLSSREAARLMGLPDSYVLPANYNEAYHIAGDGLAVPAVRYLAAHLLEPLLAVSTKPNRSQLLMAAE